MKEGNAATGEVEPSRFCLVCTVPKLLCRQNQVLRYTVQWSVGLIVRSREIQISRHIRKGLIMSNFGVVSPSEKGRLVFNTGHGCFLHWT
jgi:hypothetical protein